MLTMRFLMALSLITIVLLAGCTQATQQPTVTKPSGQTFTIAIDKTGFTPGQLGIKAGDTVVFTNRDTSPHWSASNPHPIHNGYPEKGGCIESTFDACKPLAQGEQFKFTFLYTGTWCYHDHLNPSLTGCITVQ